MEASAQDQRLRPPDGPPSMFACTGLGTRRDVLNERMDHSVPCIPARPKITPRMPFEVAETRVEWVNGLVLPLRCKDHGMPVFL
jgi:hypothetical protein